MKWIGQHIVDFIARFRSDVYLENIADGTVASDKFLGLDSNNKIVKETVSAAVTDLHSVGVDGAANQLLTDGGDGTITSEPLLTHDGGEYLPNTNLFSGSVAGPSLNLVNTVANAGANGVLKFVKQRGSSAADAVDGDNLGTILFTGYDDGTPSTQTYATIFSEIIDSGSDAETGRLELQVAEYDGTVTTGLKLDGQAADGEIDVTIGAGAASVTTVAGTLTMGSTAALTNAGLVAVANQSNITGVGALGSGTIASGFGNIDNGSSTLDTGVATVASLVCTAGATFGGGFGTSGATIATTGAISTDSTLTSTGLIISGSAAYGGYARFYEGTNNGTNYMALRAPSAVTANATLYLPDGDGSADQVIKTDGSGNLSWTDMSGGTVGWHGSGTRIKILHSDFIPDDGGRPAMIDDTGVGSEELFLESYSSNTLYATVAIPTGYTATHVMIYGSAADAVEVWEHQINSKTGVSKGTGNVDTEINITDVASSTTNYLFIQVANASGNEVHGGYITIAES